MRTYYFHGFVEKNGRSCKIKCTMSNKSPEGWFPIGYIEERNMARAMVMFLDGKEINFPGNHFERQINFNNEIIK